ncbi:MAG: hypothetical protein ACOVQG_04895 [Crocinitomicaceae bacterium]|jgi:hypothetical protein
MKSYILFTAALILFSCSNAKKMSQNPENNTHLVNSSDIKIAILGDNNQNSISTTINNVVLKDNLLEISINYTGGCSKHEFELVGSEMISKSLPPIRSINLIHKTLDEESCKRTMYDTLYFDITNLAYQKTSGSVIKLNLADWKEQLVYTFK